MKKLSLKKTVLRELSQTELNNVNGGTGGGVYTCDSNATCTGTACIKSIRNQVP